MPRNRVCLINMPFAVPEAPSLGLAQLRSVVERRFGDAMAVEVLDLNFEFVGFFGGLENYRRMYTGTGHLAGLGDWFFRQVAFPGAEDNAEAYLARYFFADDEDTVATREMILGRRAELGGFMRGLVGRFRLADADVVGFTTLFFQTVASFAMARVIKEQRSEVVTVVGGAACETTMGLEYARRVPQVDYVFSGPGLVSFPEFLGRRLVRGDTDGCDRIDGVFSKNNLPASGSAGDGPGMMGEELDINADLRPDFGPFLDRFEREFPFGETRPMLYFETSRGCSWGEKVACSFCGLNGMSMGYRPMESRIALDHLQSLFRYVPRCRFFLGVDTIVPRSYLDEVFPDLATPRDAALMYEVRSDLSESEMRVLCEAGVLVVQPGIEALSTHTLRLMRKGATAFSNLRFLKRAARFPLRLEWNLLIGSPGEDDASLEKYLRDLPDLFHLHPPTGVYPISFDRFSVYFLRSEQFGIELEPQGFYQFTFPFPPEAIARVAYHFFDRSADHARINRRLDELGVIVSRWRERWEGADGLERAGLVRVRGEGGSSVIDSRSGHRREYRLDRAAGMILDALAEPMSRDQLATRVQGGGEIGVDEFGTGFEFVRECGLLFEEHGRYLSLVDPAVGDLAAE